MLQLLAIFFTCVTSIEPWLAMLDDGVALGVELLLFELGLLLGFEVDELDCATLPETRTCSPTCADSFDVSPVSVYCVPEASVRMKPLPAEP